MDALSYLNAVLDRCVAQRTKRLPSVAALAREGKFSATTISRALRALRDAGRVMIVPRGGVFLTGVAGGSVSCPAPSGYRHRWREVRDALLLDVHQTRYRFSQPIPGTHELCARFGASRRTVSRALEELVVAGLLERRRRTYVFIGGARPEPKAAIGVVTLIPNIAMLTRYNARTERFWRSLEEELHHRSLRYALYHIDEPRREQSWSRLTPRAVRREPFAIMGFILLGLRFEGDEELFNAAIRRLAALGKPVVVVEDDGAIEMEPICARFAHTRLVRFFTMGTTTSSGEKVGRYLLANGHRNVACFSLFDNAVWCRNRTRGVELAFEKAGMVEAVSRVLLTGYESYAALATAMEREPAYAEIRREIRHFQERSLAHTGLDEGQFFQDNFDYALWLRFVSKDMITLFEQVLRARDCTAWVTLFDMLGLLALSWLRQENVRLPRELSLVSFDNISESFSAGLSSFDFEVGAVVHAAVAFVVDGGPRQGRPSLPVEPFGYVSARGSSGPAPHH
jgi:DNA-binding transcriptional regulator YhcF (GntR family)